MQRAYHKWLSNHLGRDMEMLVFGHAGVPIIFFPTRSAHFYDLENWRIIEALHQKLDSGHLQVYCVDSIDGESLYSTKSPSEKIIRHIQYEKYILEEVIPFIRNQNSNSGLIAAGCSLGGYHAINIALKHPLTFTKALGMSGRYDLTRPLAYFADLFDGYYDENIYYNMPNHFIPRISDERLLEQLRNLDITLVIGRQDSFLYDNMLLSSSLARNNIPHHLHIWEEEAHKPRYWREMVKLYL